MKKSLITLLFCVSFLIGCTGYEEDFSLPVDIQAEEAAADCVAVIANDVTSAELDNILKSLYGERAGSRDAGYEMTIIKDKEGNDCIIKIDFANDNGFALLSATKTHEPILAYSCQGNFNRIDELPFPLNEWFEGTMENISNSFNLPPDSLQNVSKVWKLYETRKKNISRDQDYSHSGLAYLSEADVARLNSIAQETLNALKADGYRIYKIDDHPGTQTFPDFESTADFMMGITYPYYATDYWAISYVAEKDCLDSSGAGHCFKTTWQQTIGYNQVFPLKPDSKSERIPVGCGPIAVGQIMYHFKYPAFFNWDDMTTGFYGNVTTSNFLYDVYMKSGATYEPNKGTGTDIDGLAKALDNYGYSYKKIKDSNINYSAIIYGTPAIMASNLDKSNGHAWIIEGVHHTQQYTETQIFGFPDEDTFKSVYYETTIPVQSTRFYVNWGWGGSYDGYYTLTNYTPPCYNSNKFQKYSLMSVRPKK
ncbi:MAG: C10 family peptidase [Muribaculaceae bacterium]|nr:C10 family peptidase [Muribaculaceae bacterium]